VLVIATTAHALDDDIERCLAAGMDDYLTKPIEFDELFALVERAGRRLAALGGPAQTTEPHAPVEAW
jgi:CheY-like chemotaxis protein